MSTARTITSPLVLGMVGRICGACWEVVSAAGSGMAAFRLAAERGRWQQIQEAECGLKLCL